MNNRNYIKTPYGTTVIARPRFANETIRGNKNPTGAADKDASTFPLATAKAILASLRSLYSISQHDEKEILISLNKTP